ncbi:hypothetical protein [Aeromonas veronii]|uniref:hypothetical protein n=1 Tax=Aeromonas veronii TaxID=654 RepID=UPI00191CFF68|nr:hypothetical protein [Aeromonas veronii]
MSRAVTADHVLFDECIDAFRRERDGYRPYDKRESYSFLLTPFKIDEAWDLGKCQVSPSVEVTLPGAYSAFISKVKNPEWVDTHNSHLFGIALSTIISAVTLKPCKSTRDDYLCRLSELSEYDMHQLAIIHPVLVAGPGANYSRLSKSKQDQMRDEISNFIDILFSLDYKIYRIVMQSLRLIHLSLVTKRDDFGLAYFLVISAMESVAQNAIKRDKVKRKDADEAAWKKKANENPLFQSLLEAYLDSRGKNEYLRERFIRFIEVYAPVENWEKYVVHPMQDMADSIKEINPSHNLEHLTGKHWFEKYPDDFTGEEINLILSNVYVHRSCFVHRGEQPPHTDPNPSFNRFFQEVREYDGYNIKKIILPNYELLLGLAKNSIYNWTSEKLNKA